MIYVLHVAHEHEEKRLHRSELEEVVIHLSMCRMELKDADVAWSTLRAIVQERLAEEASMKQHSRFRLFGQR